MAKKKEKIPVTPKKPEVLKPISSNFLIALLIIITIAVFAPSLRNEFINLDDPQYVTENAVIQSLNTDNLKLLFTQTFVGNYQPVSMLTYMLEYRLFGPNAHVFHLTNLVFHLANTLLVFFIFYRLTKKNLIAFITAALFSIHPLHVESVAWVAARKDVVYAFFFLFSIFTYLKFVQEGKKQFLLISLVLFVLSILSKAQAVVLPMVLVLIDYLMNRPLNKKTLMEKVPFFTLSLLFGILAFLIQKKSGAVQDFAYFPFYVRLLFACFGLAGYLYKSILPIDLSCFYPYPETNDQINNNWVYLSPLILVVILFILYKYGRKSRIIVFGSLFFLLTIALVLQLIPVGDAVMADRYTYIPLIGIFFIVAYYFEQWYSRRKNKMLMFGGIGYLAILAVLSFIRTTEWKDSISIYSSSLKKHPAAIIYNNRGAAYSKKEMHQEALEDFNHVLKLKPRYPNGNQNRGIVYQKLNNFEKAIEDFTTEIKINAKNSDAYFNRANSFKSLNKYDEAIKDFTKMLEINPDNMDAYYSRGESYGRSGKYTEAIADFDKVLSIKPDYAEAYSNRGIAYSLAGNTEKALQDFSKAIEIKPESYNSYMNRAVALKGLGKYADALKDATYAKEHGHPVEESFIQELQALAKQK